MSTDMTVIRTLSLPRHLHFEQQGCVSLHSSMTNFATDAVIITTHDLALVAQLINSKTGEGN